MPRQKRTIIVRPACHSLSSEGRARVLLQRSDSQKEKYIYTTETEKREKVCNPESDLVKEVKRTRRQQQKTQETDLRQLITKLRGMTLAVYSGQGRVD